MAESTTMTNTIASSAPLQELDIFECWKKDGCHLSAVIMTSFSHFDPGLLEQALSHSVTTQELKDLLPNVYLLECNPCEKNIKLFGTDIPVIPPKCAKCGASIKCCDCIGNTQKPQMYYHPKLWCFRFEKNDDIIWRIVVSSRNASKAGQSFLDGCFMADGRPVQGAKPGKSTSLRSVLAVRDDKYLGKRAGAYSRLLEELDTLQYDGEFGIYADGALGNELKNASELWIVSPFANGAFFAEILEKKPKVHVYGPLTEMQYLYSELNGRIDGFELFGSTEIPLHAKIYLARFEGDIYRLYIGSHNATKRAFSGNRELSAGFAVEEDKANAFQRWCRQSFPSRVLSGGARKTDGTAEQFQTIFDEKSRAVDLTSAQIDAAAAAFRKGLLDAACKRLSEELTGKAAPDLNLALCCMKPEEAKKGVQVLADKITNDYPALAASKDWQDYCEGVVKLTMALSGEG